MPENSSPKILIVDDEASLRNVYARYLSEEGFEVMEAGDEQEALTDFKGKPPRHSPSGYAHAIFRSGNNSAGTPPSSSPSQSHHFQLP